MYNDQQRILKEGMARLLEAFTLLHHSFSHILTSIHTVMVPYSHNYDIFLPYPPLAVMLSDLTICATQSASITCEDYSPARRDVYNV